MKILRVKLSNLNSLRGTFTIDFTDEAFTSSGIFAITGPTGAGKSTILDAICLALYSKTPRLNDIGSSNEIMTRSEGTCMAKVIFETANKHYLASFEQHRSRNKMDGALQNKTHLLIELDKDLQGGKSIASGRSVPNKVSEITGLDFDKFTKSMLLAQGNFANFLKSNDNERSELLEKLTGTAIYSRISQFVYQKDKEAKLLLESLKGSLEQIDILSDGDLKEKEDAVKAIVEKIKVLENENQHLNTVLNKFTEFNKAKKSAQDLHHEQQTLTAKFEEFKPKERKIYKAKKANLIKNDYFNLKDKEKNLQELNNEIELLTTSLTLLKSDKDTLETNLKNKNETFLKHKEKIAAFKKISDKVIELDAKIALESNALRQLKLSKEDLQEKENLCKKNLANNKKSLLNLQNKQKTLTQYLQENIFAAKLPEAISALQTKLEQVNELFYKDLTLKAQERDSLTAVIKKLEEENEKNTASLDKNKSELSKLNNKEQEVNTKITALLAGKSIQEYRQNADKYSKLIDSLDKLFDAYAKRDKSTSDLNEILLNLSNLIKAQNNLVVQCKEKEKNLLLLQKDLKHKEALYNLKQKAMSFDEQRHQLKEGEPCPLCGSTVHPYAADLIPWSDADEIELNNLKENYEKLDKEINQQNIRLVKISSDIEHKEKQKQLLQQEIAEQQNITAAKEQKLSAMLSSINIKNFEEFNPNKISDLKAEFSLSLLSIQNIIKQTDKSNDEKQKLSTQISQVQNLVNTLAQKSAAISTELKEKSAQHTILNKEISTIKQEINNKLDILISEFLQHQVNINKSERLDEDLKNIADGISALQNKNSDYKRKQKDEEKNRQEIAEKQQINDTETAKLQLITAQLEQTTKSFTKKDQNLNDIKTARVNLFGNNDVKTYQSRLDETLLSLEQSIKQITNNIQESASHIAQKEGSLSVKENNRLLLNTQYSIDKNNFINALRTQEFLNIEDFEHALIEDEELNELTNEQKHLQDLLLSLNTKISENQKILDDLSANPDLRQNEKESVIALERNKAELNKLSEEKGYLRSIIEKHFDNVQKFNEKAKEYKKQEELYTRYHRLCTLIGTADGKKYRKFVQNISLEYLISLANHEMTKLTDRYKLCVSDDEKRPLEIDVIDLYQFSSHRPTSNLSGGETFLVSLALALGLSKMASQNVQVNSLFLDEGFGTLDDEALESALDTLASLQKEGKLIGVISHVAKLKERIRTQIEVQKLAGGYSTIKGAGCSRT